MLTRYGAFVYARRRAVLAVSALVLALSIVAMGAVGGDLRTTGFVDESSESARVDELLADEFGRGDARLILLFDAGRPIDADAQARIEGALAPLGRDPRVVRLLTAWNTGDPNLISTDGTSTYAVALIAGSDEEIESEHSELVELVQPGPGIELTVTGDGPIGEAISSEVEEGIIRAETIGVPLTIVMQLVVFGGLVAAGVPLLVGALAIVGALAVVFVVSQVTDQSVFAANIISLLGLGLGVDYSLFMVARFREEVQRRPVAEAVAVMLATVGRAILFSGITVIFGLAATQFFPLMAVRSMGQAGMIVVAISLVYALTFLPALLAVLGARINAVPLGFPRIFHRGPSAPAGAMSESRFWGGVGRFTMRRPVLVLLPVLALLLVTAVPFARLNLTAGNVDVLPEDSSPRVVSKRLDAEFAAGEAEAVPVVLTAEDGNALSPASLAAARAYVDAAAGVPGVDGVIGIFATPDGTPIDWAGYDGTPATIPAAAQPLLARYAHGDALLVQVLTHRDGDSEPARDLVRALRGIDAAGVDVAVGGFTASGLDTIDAIQRAALPAVLFVLVGSYLILLLTFGSVFLPLKAIFMTLLSIGASMGALVTVFQDGFGDSLLGFSANGTVISTTPILMFAILFGLSMDYEVLLLSRVQEEWERGADNVTSVRAGLERTAKVITGAAAIMVVVFGAFMAADITIIKSFGFGLTLAVLLDATIVRGLLVPATMRLMGRWNWWAPRRVQAVVQRVGLAHGTAK